MLFFSRKSRRKKKATGKKVKKQSIPGLVDPLAESHGYDPYDTLPGLPRDEFGMRRQDDGKWSF